MEEHRMQAWVGGWRERWWPVGAGLVAAVFSAASVMGFLETDGAPFFERLAEVALLVVAAAVILVGLVARTRTRRVGSIMVVVGSLPGAAAIILFWHPGFVAVGLLSTAVISTAYSDATSGQLRPTGSN
jgi:hypothetical protein